MSIRLTWLYYEKAYNYGGTKPLSSIPCSVSSSFGSALSATFSFSLASGSFPGSNLCSSVDHKQSLRHRSSIASKRGVLLCLHSSRATIRLKSPWRIVPLKCNHSVLEYTSDLSETV